LPPFRQLPRRSHSRKMHRPKGLASGGAARPRIVEKAVLPCACADDAEHTRRAEQDRDGSVTQTLRALHWVCPGAGLEKSHQLRRVDGCEGLRWRRTGPVGRTWGEQTRHATGKPGPPVPTEGTIRLPALGRLRHRLYV
jgi:hypothetical protein